jgi:hypothetical protein
MRRLGDRIRRYTPWEVFWQAITGIGLGVILIIFSIINIHQWGLFISILAFIAGVVLTLLSFESAKRNFEKM